MYSHLFIKILHALPQPFVLNSSLCFPVHILSRLIFPGLISSVILAKFINFIKIFLYLSKPFIIQKFSVRLFVPVCLKILLYIGALIFLVSYIKRFSQFRILKLFLLGLLLENFEKYANQCLLLFILSLPFFP
jgi:hypothetical protein